ncbi:MAG: LptF/LptG family permease [Armatimonadota bacterium]
MNPAGLRLAADLDASLLSTGGGGLLLVERIVTHGLPQVTVLGRCAEDLVAPLEAAARVQAGGLALNIVGLLAVECDLPAALDFHRRRIGALVAALDAGLPWLGDRPMLARRLPGRAFSPTPVDLPTVPMGPLERNALAAHLPMWSEAEREEAFEYSLRPQRLGEYIGPPAARKAREAFAEIGLSQPVVQERSSVFFRDEKERRIFYVGHMDPKTNELKEITIWGSDAQGRLAQITTARWAEMKRNVWYLREGSTVTLDQYGDQQGPVQRFREQEITLQAALQDYYSSRKTAFEMSAGELGEMISALGPAGGDTQKLAVQYHFKYSIPMACLIFALIAAPISFRFAHYGSFVGIVIAIMIVFLYNGVRSWTLAFGLAGSLDPLLAGWVPDMLFGGLGVYLLTVTR